MVRALVDTLTIKFARESLQDIDGYDLFKLYKDVLLTESKEKKLNKVYRSKYGIPIDHGILNNHGAFYPEGLSSELVFEFRLAHQPAKS